jgi:hypothetical protein
MEDLAEETKSCHLEGMVVEQSNPPLNGSMKGLAKDTERCHPESVNERRICV